LHPDNVLLAETHRASSARSNPSFAVPVAESTYSYVPAEYPEQLMKVQLRAVAEQTGYEPGRWQTAFLVRAEA
jgi:hypothetical protein